MQGLVGAFRAPRVGAGFEAATVDDALTLAAEVVPIHAEIVGRAREAEAPTAAPRNEAGEITAGIVGGALGAAIGVELNATGPRREEGERLPVVNVEAFEADGVREVLLGGDPIGTVGDGIESVEREEFRRGFEHGAAKEIPYVGCLCWPVGNPSPS